MSKERSIANPKSLNGNKISQIKRYKTNNKRAAGQQSTKSITHNKIFIFPPGFNIRLTYP